MKKRVKFKTRNVLGKSGKSSESIMQARFFTWLLIKYPKLRLNCFAIPNGGSRHVLEAINLKRAGVTPGIPDIFCAISKDKWHGLFIEFKYGKNKLTDSQKLMFDNFSKSDYKCAVCYSLEEAEKVFEEYIEGIIC